MRHLSNILPEKAWFAEFQNYPKWTQLTSNAFISSERAGPLIRPANNSRLSWNLDNAPNIFFENKWFFTILDPLKHVQKKIFIIDKEILLIKRNSEHSDNDIENKILIIFKESLHAAGNLANFHHKSIKVCHLRQMRIFLQKVH